MNSLAQIAEAIQQGEPADVWRRLLKVEDFAHHGKALAWL
jgi:hypothetical protein